MRFAIIAPPAAAPMAIANAAHPEILLVSPREKINGLTAAPPRPAPMAPTSGLAPGGRLEELDGGNV